MAPAPGRSSTAGGVCAAAVIAALGGSICAVAIAGEPNPASLEHFEKHVRPVLVEHCLSCHGPEKQKGGLRLDSRASVLAGGDSGPAIVPGDPAASRLVTAVSYAAVDLQMPPRGKLPESAIRSLERWVAQGAEWPAGGPVPAGAPRAGGFDLEARRREHWAWQPVVDPPVPSPPRSSWAAAPPDRFILAGLAASGLEPSREAPRSVLLWRAAYDLTGLAPPAAELDEFEADDSPDAYERRLDALLSSPRFGEHWARRWLDLVRYCETLGHEFDYAVPNAWRYRDYIIAALNEDVPHDQMVREHVAGDLITPPRRGPAGENESVKGTAFYWFTQQAHSPVDQLVQTADRIENQIDVLSKAFLGLTVACARCHDHKFDAISTRDYYGFYGYLASSRYTQAQVDSPQRIEARAARLAELRSAIAGLAGDIERPESGAGAAGLAAGDVLYATFERGIGPWLAEGPAWRWGAAPPGTLALRGDGELPEVVALHGGWAHSGLLSARLQGSLRSPQLTITHRFIHLLVAGRDARANIVIDGFNILRDPIYGGLKRGIGRETPHWIAFDVERWRGRRAHIELNDLEPGDLSTGDHGPLGWIAIGAAVFSSRAEAPGGLMPGRTIDSPGSGFPPEHAAQARELWRQYRQIEASIPAPTYVPAMADGDGESVRVFVRGNPYNLGEPAPRGFLSALGGAAEPGPGEGSGRLELARRMTGAGNPLAARVHVNRLWHHVFGRGIVPTVDDFGVLGEKPTHPELLDWLAARFREEGSSTKKLLRLLLTSSAYRQSSASRPDAEERDPQNRWYHRANLRRLEGEAIRDRMLALSGGLNLAGGGPSVAVHLTPFLDGRGRPGASGPLDGARKRSVFLEVRRNFLSPLFTAFDTPLPATTVGRRNVSNVPAQALFLLNDPFVREEAVHWARDVLEHSDLTAPERVEALYSAAFGRRPTASEREQALEFVGEQDRPGPGPAAAPSLDAWGDLCHVLLNAKEFIFIP